MKNKAEKVSKKQWYEKYRWFYTSNNHLVIGGKSAETNEELIKLHKKFPKYIVMHTKTPGSPFSIIISDKFTEKDLEETAVFTGCFSRAWKEGKKSILIDIFLMEQIVKNKNMKTGTFGVVGPVDHKKVNLKLYLTHQEKKVRFVPQQVQKSIFIVPGKTSKEQIAEELAVKLETIKEEILNALPTGGFQLCN